MTEAAPPESRYVVEVTAPLPPGRVRFVAAEAAARLDLPVEKLIGLLENRVGPVTKPLARESAERVAEVLDRAGAEVALRGEHEPELAAAQSHDRASAEAGGTAAPVAPEPQSGSQPELGAAEPDVEREDEAGPDARPFAASAPETPPPRAETPAAVGSEPDGPRSGRADDAWSAVEGEFSSPDNEDPEMLGAWTGRWQEPGSRTDDAPGPVSRRPPTGPSPMPGTPLDRPGGPDRARGSAAPVSWRDDDAWPEEPASDGELGEDEDVFGAHGYGPRDPFEEGRREEVAQRRWFLVIALVVALVAFLALQWAYSDRTVGASAPPGYERGLRAYRDGAFVSAARAWRPRAEVGDASAMFMLGYMAEFGQGRPWSNGEAAGWYREAGERGHAGAQVRLARLYLRGLGVERSRQEALRWLEAAARAGHVDAQTEAARLLVVEGRYARALEWYETAAPRDPQAAAFAAFAREAVASGRPAP